MSQLLQILLRARIWDDDRGQDFIEYTLLASFVAVTAAAISPTIASPAVTIISHVSSALTLANVPS